MSLFQGLRAASRARSSPLVERLCRQIGWDIDERRGNASALYFKGDSVTRQRAVIVIHDDGDPVLSFSCNSQAEFREQDVPNDLVAAVLLRNNHVTLGAWTAEVEHGTVTFGVRYAALAAGLDAKMFQAVCLCLLKEVAEVEATLHRKGLI